MPFLHFFRSISAFFILFLLSFSIFAQKAGLEVTRCEAIDRTLPVRNISIDATGRKWVANKKGVFEIRAHDLANLRAIPDGEKSALSVWGGNADVSWDEEELKTILDKPCTVTSCWYDVKSQELWVGTDEAGFFQLKTNPSLKLVQQYSTANTKLKTNFISSIFQDKTGRFWVGTQQGLLYGAPGRWKSDLSGYPVQRVREYGSEIYVLADGEISKTTDGSKWTDLNIEPKNLEGQINDFDVDPSGYLWIVSGILTRMDLAENRFDLFSGPEYYTSEYGNCIAVAPDGGVWVGTDDKGLFLVDKASNMIVNLNLDEGISCDGNGRDAVVSVKVTGGDQPFTYNWAGGLIGANPKNISPGNYSVTVSDVKGKSRVASIAVPDTRLKPTVKQKRNASGPGASDGVAFVDLDGNASGVKALWDNGETMVEAVRLSPGTHSVTITNQKGCVSTATVTITEKAAPIGLALIEKKPIKCMGELATLSAKTTGGRAPYKYKWSIAGQESDQAAGIAPGSYSVTVTDAEGKTMSASIAVNAPKELKLDVQIQSPASAGAADGKAFATAKGGTGVISYQWDTGEKLPASNKLSGGKHSVSVTDENGCIALAIIEVTENIGALTANVFESSKISCAGQPAAIQVKTTGGKGPFQYKWSNPTFSGDQVNGVQAGIYSVTVTDAAGSSSTATITVEQPPALALTVDVQSPAATGQANGKAKAEISGGSGKYQFLWSTGESTALAEKLAPGENTVTVTDSKGCTASASVRISENVQPLSVSISQSGKINCAGESTKLKVAVAGGKAPFRFAWSNAALRDDAPDVVSGDYTLTVTDSKGTSSTAVVNIKAPAPLGVLVKAGNPAGIGASDGQATAEVQGGTAPYAYQWDSNEKSAKAEKLATGEHKLTVTDANGCSATASVSISENIQPLSISITQASQIKCAGETATLAVSVSGGKSPFRYNWSDPLLKEDKPTAKAGDYSLTITDSKGTSSTGSISVVQPPSLTVTTKALGASAGGAANGQALAEPHGGKAPISFAWDSGEKTAKAEKLSGGDHQVTVTDANGCFAITSVSITENISALSISLVVKKPLNCAGEKAQLQLQTVGGKGPYTTVWNQAGLAGDNLEVEAGNYAVTVTDAKGSSQTGTVEIKAAEAIVVTLEHNLGASSETLKDGKASVSVKGGTPNYTITWDGKSIGTNVQNLGIGKHTVVVKDAKGCTESLSFTTPKIAMPELKKAIANGQTIRMRALTFDTDSDKLKDESASQLDELYDFMVENPKIEIEVGGHTNNLPSDAFADKLSTNRAKAVADYLTSKGIEARRVQYKGYGKRSPLEANTTEEGRKINQRVEIKILKS